jgi:hypothetical protein
MSNAKDRAGEWEHKATATGPNARRRFKHLIKRKVGEEYGYFTRAKIKRELGLVV